MARRCVAAPNAIKHTVTSQYAHVQRGRPFSLDGADATGRPRPVHLPMATYT